MAWMIYRGDLLDAELSERWGLIEKRSEEGQLDADVDELVETILANGPGIGRKGLNADWERMSLQDGIMEGIESIAQAVKHGESKRYINETISGLRNRRQLRTARRPWI